MSGLENTRRLVPVVTAIAAKELDNNTMAATAMHILADIAV
jgi:hypothetical protein